MCSESGMEEIEHRLGKLETKVYGSDEEAGDGSEEKTILDALQETDTVLISALSGRQHLNALLKRIQDIENVLDPRFLEVGNAGKVESVFESKEEMKACAEHCDKIKKLSLTLNDEQFVTSVEDGKVDDLKAFLMESLERCRKQTEKTYDLINEYEKTMLYATEILEQIDKAFVKMEEKKSSAM